MMNERQLAFIHHSSFLILSILSIPVKFSDSNYSPPFDLVAAGTDERERLRISLVLFKEYARGERLFGVGVEDGDDALRDDGAAVQSLVNEVDGAAGEADAVLDGLALRVEAGEGRKQ